MNEWNVIAHEEGFVCLTSDQWNEMPEYAESWLIRSGLTRTQAIMLTSELNYTVTKWEEHNEL